MIKGIITISLGLFAAMAVSAQRTTAVTRGNWGGQGVMMDVTASGARLQFDCADGEITKQLRMKKNGAFEAVGTFTRSGPGPIRIDRPPAESAVRYKGKVSGKAMTLTVTDSKTGDVIATFTLTRGASGRIHRCL